MATTTDKVQAGLNLAGGFLALAPSILQLIAIVNQLIQANKQGPAKKEIVMSAVPDEHKEQASQFIDNTVAIVNKANSSN